MVGIPNIGRYIDFFKNWVFLKSGSKITKKGVKIGNSAQKSAKFDSYIFVQKRGKSKFSGGSPVWMDGRADGWTPVDTDRD